MKTRKINLDDIRVDRVSDGGYQRDEVSDAKLSAMVDNFTDEACTPLLIGERKNGSLWVVDGQQRLAVLRRLGRTAATCAVFESAGRKHEASVYYTCNAPPQHFARGTGRHRMHGTDIFAAAAVAGMPPVVEIADYLASKGLKVNRHGKPKCVGFTAMLVRVWAWDPDATRRALDTCLALAGDDEPLVDSIFRGFFWLYHNGIDAGQHLDKLIRAGGTSVILGKIRARAIGLGKGVSEAVAGEAIRDMINKGRHNKIGVVG